MQAISRQAGIRCILAPTQAQSELLEATVTVQLPEQIQTIGETVRYLLQRSGYRRWLLVNPPHRKRSRYLRYRCRLSIAILDR